MKCQVSPKTLVTEKKDMPGNAEGGREKQPSSQSWPMVQSREEDMWEEEGSDYSRGVVA